MKKKILGSAKYLLTNSLRIWIIILEIKILALVFISKKKSSYKICLDEMQMFNIFSLKINFEIFITKKYFFPFPALQPYQTLR